MTKRPDSHIKETKSLAFLMNVWAEWSINKQNEDYGIDLEIMIFENHKSTNISFSCQLKSTDNIETQNGFIKYSIDTEHLYDFFKQSRPFIFIIYDNKNDNAYWLIIQTYIWDILSKTKPDWNLQKTITLEIPIENKINNKESVKMAIINTQKRMIQEDWLQLDFGEGLGLNNTLNDIEKLNRFEQKTEIKLKQAKLLLAHYLSYQGNDKAAVDKILEIYNQKKRDIPHLRAIITLTSQLNIANKEENEKVISLCTEGIKLSEELKDITSNAILTTYKNKAIYFIISKKIGELLYSRKIYNFSNLNWMDFFVNDELQKLSQMLIELNEEINYILKRLIENNNYFILTYILTELLDISTMLIMQLKLYDENKWIEQEISNKKILSEHLLKLVSVFKDKELELNIKDSVASFYYYSQHPDAINLMRDALKIAVELDNKPEIQKLNHLIEHMINIPDPYNIQAKKEFKKLTTKELQDSIKESLRFQGIKLDSKDDITDGILLGLNDLDLEKYLQFCKNIYIEYTSTSLVGQMTGLPSLGSKVIYCPFGGMFEGVSLENLFNGFVHQFCKNCKKRELRDKDWKCTVEWLEQRERPNVIKKIIEQKVKN